MKGIIFTEFIGMVEEKFGFEVSEKIISRSDLSTGGAYTAVGTYPVSEIRQLLGSLSGETGQPVQELLYNFGGHLFKRFFRQYPHLFDEKQDVFGFLSLIENYIHVEVLKLYPDAQLPTIATDISADGREMKMVYHSSRKMSDLARGLIHGCSNHFKEDISLEILDKKNDGEKVTFLLTKA